MSRLFLVVAVVAALFSAPALIACEKCVSKGSLDPNGGGPYNSAICWTASNGGWSWCVGGNTSCTGDDTENVCPEGGATNCITLSNGNTICFQVREPNASEPLGRCGGTDLQGRCDARSTRMASLLN